MPKRFAAQLSEIRLNDDDRINVIAVDCDLPAVEVEDSEFDQTHWESAAAVAWREADAPPPNLVIVNRKSLRAHLVWLLHDPINLLTQPHAPRNAHAIQRALTRLIPGGDLAYAWASATMHNPWDEANYDVSAHRADPYRLDELAAYLDLENERRVKTSHYFDVVNNLNFDYGSRNQSMHEALVAYARATLNSGKKITSDGLWEEVFRLNALCMPALGDGELKGIVLSKIRYWGGRVPRDRAAELKGKRATEGRSLELVRTKPMEERRKRARAMRASGMTIAAIAKALELGERTVYRYFEVPETLIEVIRRQDIPGEGAASLGTEAAVSIKLEHDVPSARSLLRVTPMWHAKTPERRRRREPTGDDHEAICACGCQDRGGGRWSDAAFGMFADTA